MSTTYSRSGNKGTITLEGELTLHSAEETRRLLIKALVDTDEVFVSMKDAQVVDLSCLQLLCSAHRSAVRFKKRLSWSARPPQIFLNAAGEAGFARVTGCKLDCNKSCLWAALTGAHHG